MAGMSVDVGELLALARDISGAGGRVTREARQSVSKGALNVKNQLRKDMSASRSFKGVTPGIDYEMSGNDHFSEARIGPRKGKPGSLANIAYFGSSRGGGTVRDPKFALEEEAPRFFDAVEALAAKAVLGD